jgi:hypothetical protein
MVGSRKRYAVADSAQQVVGGFLLAGPFVVTEEVWVLASDMTWLQALSTVLIVFLIGYGALYKADDEDVQRLGPLGRHRRHHAEGHQRRRGVQRRRRGHRRQRVLTAGRHSGGVRVTESSTQATG